MARPQDEQHASAGAIRQDAPGTQTPCAETLPSRGRWFEIRVRGHLNRQWSDWLEGLEPTLLDNGEMVLSGTIVDQAALLGILNKLNGLNLTILSVNAIDQKG